MLHKVVIDMALSDYLYEDFSGKLDPGSAEDQNTDDLFNFLPDVETPDIRLPSQQERQDPGFNFGTDPVSPRVSRAARGAQTEVTRGFNALPDVGKDMFLEELEEEEGGWSMLNGVFDTLNADVAAPAVFIDEMVNDSGNWSKAINRAAEVFKGGLPGYTAEESMYSHGDWMRDAGWFDTEDGTHWSLPWVGFLADLVFSPVNLLTLGSGTAMKTTAAGAVGISKARRAAQIAANPTLGIGAELLGAGKRAGGSAVLTDKVAQMGVPGAQTFGELFLPNFEKIQDVERIARDKLAEGDIAGAGRVRAKGDEFIRRHREMVSNREKGHMSAMDAVSKIYKGLPNEQSIFFQLFMDQDMKRLENHLRTYYREIAPDGVLDESIIKEALERARDFKDAHEKIRLGMKEVGLIDNTEIREAFSPLVVPTSGRSLKWSKQVLADNDAMRKYLETANVRLTPDEQARGVEALRQYKDPAEAAAAAIPYEMDIGKSTFKYSLQANAKINTKRMLEAWLTNPEIARPMAVNADVAARSSGKVTDDVTMLRDPEYRKKWVDTGYVLYDPGSLREIPLGQTSEEFDKVIDAFQKTGDHSSQLFWIPKTFADDLTMSRSLYDDSNALHRLTRKVQSVQSMWKSYALLSPGYHMRNLHSNLFMNFIAGVTDPRHYMEAMAVQAGGTANLRSGVRQIVESVVGKKSGSDVLFTDKHGKKWTVDNLHKSANDRAILSSGLFDQDLPMEIERQLMSQLDRAAGVAMNRHTFTRGAARLQQEAMDTGMSEDDAKLNAMIHNAKARNLAAGTGKSPEEYYYNKRIQAMDEDRYDMAIELEDEDLGVRFDQSQGGGTEFFRQADPEAGELEGHLYGELENVMHRTFLDGRIPSADTLKNRIVNGRDFRQSNRDGNKVWSDIYPEGSVPIDPKNLMKRAQEVLRRDENFGDWYKDFGEGMSGIVGDENMVEFSNVFAILSGRKLVEQNFAESAFVMRRMREGFRSGDEWSRENFMKWMSSEPMTVRNSKTGSVQSQDVPTQIMGKKAGVGQMGRLFDFYDGAFDDQGIGKLKGGPKTTNFTMNVLHRSRSDFYPFVVTDSIIASLFGFRTGNKFGFSPRGNHAQYRYAQHMIAQIAKNIGRSPDEVMASLWADGKAKNYMLEAEKEGGEIGMTGSARAVLGANWPHANVEKWRQGDFLASRIGSWDSANEFASVELNKLKDVMGRADEGPLVDGFTFEESIKSAKGSAERSDVMVELTDDRHVPFDVMFRNYRDPNENILRQEGSPIATNRISGRSWIEKEHARRNKREVVEANLGSDAGEAMSNRSHRSSLIHITTSDPDWEADAEDIRAMLPDLGLTPDEVPRLHDPSSDQRWGRRVRAATEIGEGIDADDALDIFMRDATGRHADIFPEQGIILHPGDAFDHPFIRKRKDGGDMHTGGNVRWRIASETMKGLREVFEADIDVVAGKDKPYFKQLARDAVELFFEKRRQTPDLKAELTVINHDLRDLLQRRFGFVLKGPPEPSRGPGSAYIMVPSDKTFEIYERRGRLFQDAERAKSIASTDTNPQEGLDALRNAAESSVANTSEHIHGFLKGFIENHEFAIKLNSDFPDVPPKKTGVVYKVDDGNKIGAAAWKIYATYDGSKPPSLAVDIYAQDGAENHVFRDVVNGMTGVYADLKKEMPDLENSFYVVNPKLNKTLRRLGFITDGNRGPKHLKASDKVFERISRKGGDLLQREERTITRGAIDVRDADGNVMPLYDSSGQAIRNAIKSPLHETQYVIHLHRENQDASTLIHEMGHLFRLDGSMSRADLKAVRDFVGDDPTKRVMDMPAEEKFARAFEAYIMEGRSPVKGMESVFADMSAQLEDVYQTIPPEEITDEIRKVMDNLFKRVNEHEIAVAATQTVGQSGSRMADFSEAAQRVLHKTFGRDSRILKVNRVWGRAIENNARAAHWIHRLKRGDSDVDAASSVYKYLLDYDEITDFEKRYLRNVIPFYTWMRKSAPLQVQAALEDPARYSAVPKFMNFIEAFSEDWADVEGPDYFSESNAVRLPILYDEKPLFIVPDLPFQEFNTIGDPVKAIASGMTPFVKGPFEWYPKHAQSLFTDRPIEKYIGEPGKGMLGDAFGVSAKNENLFQTLLPTFGKLDRAYVDTFKKGEGTKRALSELGGIRVVPVDKQKIARGKLFQKQDVLRRVKKKLRDQGIIPKDSSTSSTKKTKSGRGRRGRSGRSSRES